MNRAGPVHLYNLARSDKWILCSIKLPLAWAALGSKAHLASCDQARCGAGVDDAATTSNVIGTSTGMQALLAAQSQLGIKAPQHRYALADRDTLQRCSCVLEQQARRQPQVCARRRKRQREVLARNVQQPSRGRRERKGGMEQSSAGRRCDELLARTWPRGSLSRAEDSRARL